MNLLFLSNYYTHHQQPLCEQWDALTGQNFTFVETEPFPDERKRLGWQESTQTSFVKRYENGAAQAVAPQIRQSDVVILGSAPLETVQERLKEQKLVFKYSERAFKQGYQPLKWVPRLYRYWKRYGRHRSLYLLCASAYTAVDYAVHGAFIGKCYKWGYFPQTKHYALDELFSRKDPAKLLWCGRFLDWKHPDDAVKVAKRLKDEGYRFELDMVGTGELEDAVKKQARDAGVSDCVRFLGAVSSDEVRSHMEQAGIYLFTSDFREGWGAVLNEAMNSGCVVVAGHGIGSVPFLVKHGENGLIYRNGDVEGLYRQVKYLLDHPAQQHRLGRQAYHTITQLWNAETAAARFLRLVEEIEDHGYCDLYQDGPCSRAGIIGNNWFKG